MKTPTWSMTAESATVVIDGKTYTVKKGDPNFVPTRQAILDERWGDITSLLSKGLGVEKWAKGFFKFKDQALFYKEDKIDSRLNTRIIETCAQGGDPSHLLKFWELLQNNPSYRSVDQLYNFMTNEGIAIDQDGFILTYKAVSSEFLDFHTKTVSNKVGTVNEMPRNKISDDYDVPCHTGFHVGGLSYANSFGDAGRKIIICKVNPADVVCVSKQDARKMRVCKYTVIGLHGGEMLPSTTYDTTLDLGEDEEKTSGSVKIELGPGWESLAKTGSVEPQSEVVVRDPVWKGFDDLSAGLLAEKNVDDLRKYAGQRLKIVGASRLRKEALLERIFEETINRPQN